MLGFKEKMDDLIAQGKSIRLGIVGAGQMGIALISHFNNIPGFKVCAIADKDTKQIDNICSKLEIDVNNLFIAESGGSPGILDSEYEDVLSGKQEPGFTGYGSASSAISGGKIIFTDDFSILAKIPEIDVVIDATGYTDVGAGVALASLLGGKDVVTLNVEADITVGPMLKKIADERKLIYTLAAGDEPAALKELYDFAHGLGFKIICAGKGKNNPLDRQANPSTLEEYAAGKGSSGKMMTSFVDGTKSMIEMACLSNATGLIPDCRGMHSPKAKIAELLSVFCSKSQGGILEKEGVVDFVIGDLAPGVFLIFSSKNKLIKELLHYLLMGDGPNYLLYRPYHIPGIETPLTVARAYFERQPWIVPRAGLISEVVTIAKRDLKEGEVIDGIGGYMIYGLIDEYGTAVKENLLPIGLAQGSILKKPVKKDTPIRIDDIIFGCSRLLMQMRKKQDETIQAGGG
ncbi:MAG: SAF domain protein [Actinobacteria bacterium ADurb.Bin346]|nr:MAG: SAF domain protein [Actinobacteria bacterium ADurb.Bin346]